MILMLEHNEYGRQSGPVPTCRRKTQIHSQICGGTMCGLPLSTLINITHQLHSFIHSLISLHTYQPKTWLIPLSFPFKICIIHDSSLLLVLLEQQHLVTSSMPHESSELSQLKLPSITPFGLPPPSDSDSVSVSNDVLDLSSSSSSSSSPSSSSFCFLFFPDRFAFVSRFVISLITLQHFLDLSCICQDGSFLDYPIIDLSF